MVTIGHTLEGCGADVQFVPGCTAARSVHSPTAGGHKKHSRQAILLLWIHTMKSFRKMPRPPGPKMEAPRPQLPNMRGNQAMIDEVISIKNENTDAVKDMLEQVISAGGKLAHAATHQTQGATNEEMVETQRSEMMESMFDSSIGEACDKYESAKEQADVLMSMLPDVPSPTWLMKEVQDKSDQIHVLDALSVSLQMLSIMAMTGPFPTR